MKRLAVIGAGRLGRTLARLWRERGVVAIADVVTRSVASAAAATAFIGAGRPLADVDGLAGADLFLVATPDDAIADSARALVASGALRGGNVVFHCSGSQPSALLAPVRDRGVRIASVHPVKSFARPEDAILDFDGTWCAVEGDADALAVLRPAFEAIGARLFDIDGEAKTLYHAGAVLVCNDLVALMEAGLRVYERAGVPRETALAVIEPLVRGTLDNVFRLGPVAALTGPVARGDHAVVARQLDALRAVDPAAARTYLALAGIALDLSRRQGSASLEALAELARLLQSGR